MSAIRSLTELRELIAQQAALLVAVATGGPRINEVNPEYEQRNRAIEQGVRRLGVDPPFPWRDLWGWYGHWSQHLSTYAARRQYISDLAAPALDAIDGLSANVPIEDPGGPGEGTWSSVEARISGLKGEFVSAATPDDLQDVGRRAREILLDAAVLCSRHVPAIDLDGLKEGDAKARLDLFLSRAAAGSAHEELRQLVRAVWKLAQKVTHCADISRVDAFALTQATVFLVRVLQELDA